MFTSLLGVWQAVPYIFADFCGLIRGPSRSDAPRGNPHIEVDTRSKAYRAYLLSIALVPMAGLLVSFKQVQKAYAIFVAMFMPLLATALLILNSRSQWVGPKRKNRPVTNIFLAATALLFLVAAVFIVRKW